LAGLTVEWHCREIELTPQICLQGIVVFQRYVNFANLKQKVYVTDAKSISVCTPFLLTWEMMYFLLNDAENHSNDTKPNMQETHCMV
jgi:hypothetical protein